MAGRPPRNPAHLAVVLDNLPDALLIVDSSGLVVDANAPARAIFRAGLPEDRYGRSLVGRRLADLVPALDPAVPRRDTPPRPPERRQARALDATGFQVDITRVAVPWGAGIDHLMVVLRRAPETSGAAAPGPPAHSGTGRTESGRTGTARTGTARTGTARTETARTETARTETAQTQAILRATEDAVFGVDAEGCVVLANPAAARLLGARVADIAGRDLHALALHTQEDGTPAPAGAGVLAETLRTGRRHRRSRAVVWRADGAGVPVELSTMPVRDGDTIVGAIVTCTDVSRLVEAERRHARLLDVLDGELRPGLVTLAGALPEPVAASVRQLLALVDAAAGREPSLRPVPEGGAGRIGVQAAGRAVTGAAVPPSGRAPAGAHAGSGGGATSTAELPLLTILTGDEPPPVPELLVWPAPNEATTRALTRRGWSPVPVLRPDDVGAELRPQTAAMLVDPLTGPVTRRGLAAARAAAAAAALPVLVAAGVGELERSAAGDACPDPALLLEALRTGGSEPARVLVVDGDAAVAAALATCLTRAGLVPAHARNEGEAMLRAAISPPDLVLLSLAVEPNPGPGIVGWLRTGDRLVSTPVVAYTTQTLGLGHSGRLQSGTSRLALVNRAEGDWVERRLVDLVLRLAAPR